jgi:hypothetical protein
VVLMVVEAFGERFDPSFDEREPRR